MDFKNVNIDLGGRGVGGGLPDDNEGRLTVGDYQLPRQSSIYTLTFEELQNSLGDASKDFGSMNMDEFLKNIWTVEETQAMTLAFDSSMAGPSTSNLIRQPSLTLPRTLSQKPVDEVWRDIFKENIVKEENNNISSMNFQHRQPTFGEITLEEFLVRAGVVREDTKPQAPERVTQDGIYSESLCLNNNTRLALGLSHVGKASQIMENKNTECKIASRPSAKQIVPEKITLSFGSMTQSGNNLELPNTTVRNSFLSIRDPPGNHNLRQSTEMVGTDGLRGGRSPISIAIESPVNHLSSDGYGKSNDDTSSLSPTPHFSDGNLMGRKHNGIVERVAERRQKRMIKNRESAARSRARKQAYTMELETEVAKLKEENKDLQSKQAEILEKHKKLVVHILDQHCGSKRKTLRRTQTGPW